MTETTKAQPTFELQKIYHKALDFDAPDTPSVFLDEWNPSVQIDLNTSADRLSDTTYEVVLKVKAVVRSAKGGDKPMFTVTLAQAGIFEITGYEEQELVALLGSYCPAQLYPFARSHIASLVVGGGFPQLLLAPVDFDALLEDAVQRAQDEDEAEGDQASA